MLHVKQSAEEVLDQKYGISDIPKIAVRNTELVDFASCRRKYLYIWVKGIRPKKTDGKLVLGSMVHKFLEVWETDGVEKAVKAVQTMRDEHLKKLGETDAEGREELHALYEKTAQICVGYVQWAQKEGLPPVLVPEDKFEQPIGGLMGVRVILKGTRDGLTGDQEGYFLREYKTCASIKDKLSQYTLDKQTRRYIVAARKNDLPLMGVELVLIAKKLPLTAEKLILKSPKDAISRDAKKWARLPYEEMLRVPQLGKFVEEGSKNGLTEQGYHDILSRMKGMDNPFFRLERIYFNDTELAQVTRETLVEAWTIHQTKELAETLGDDVYYRNQGTMGMNCKNCAMKTLCEMDLRGEDTSLLLQEHFEIVDPSTVVEVKDDDDGEDDDAD